MHADTARIVALWEVDHAIEVLKNEIKRLFQDVEDLRAKIADTTKESEAKATTLGIAKDEERALSRKLASYVSQRDRTKEMLESGTAPDYGAAQRQYQQCAAIADETETELLGAMEKSERATHERVDTDKKLAELANALETAQATRKAKDAGLRTELGTLTAPREERWKGLHPDDRSAYMNLLRLHKEPVAKIVNHVCAACNVEVGPQARIEVQNGKATHKCRGCQRWLIPTEESE